MAVVGRVGAEAPAADWLAGRGAAGYLGGLAAAAAGLEPGPQPAAAAAARRAEPVAQRHRLAAGRAGRGHDAGCAGGQQHLDEGVDPRRAVRALAGERPGHWSSSRSTWWRWNGRGIAAAITSSSRG